MPKDLLRIADLAARDITLLVELASNLERRRGRTCGELNGQLVAMYFTRPSPGTERAFSAAATRLGATVVVLGPEEFQRGYGASVTSIARVVSLYASVVVACTDDANLDRLATAATIPVVNGLAHACHPWQSVTELLTRDDRAAVDGFRGGHAGGRHEIDVRSKGASALATIYRRVLAPTCTSAPSLELEANRVHSAAAILITLYRRQLVGAFELPAGDAG